MREIFSQWAHSPKLKPMAGLAHAERKTRENSAKTAENQDNNIKKSLKKDGFTPSFL